MEVGEALNMTAGHLALLPTHPPTYYKWCSNYLLSTVRAPVPYSAEKTQQQQKGNYRPRRPVQRRTFAS